MNYLKTEAGAVSVEHYSTANVYKIEVAPEEPYEENGKVLWVSYVDAISLFHALRKMFDE